MKTASGKAKGRKLQQWVVDKIHEYFPTLEDGDIKSTAMGQNGEDVQLSPEARKLFPFSVECKSYAAIAVYGWLTQAISNCPRGSTPLLVIKQNHSKPLVVIDAEEFFKLVSK